MAAVSGRFAALSHCLLVAFSPSTFANNGQRGDLRYGLLKHRRPRDVHGAAGVCAIKRGAGNYKMPTMLSAAKAVGQSFGHPSGSQGDLRHPRYRGERATCCRSLRSYDCRVPAAGLFEELGDFAFISEKSLMLVIRKLVGFFVPILLTLFSMNRGSEKSGTILNRWFIFLA